MSADRRDPHWLLSDEALLERVKAVAAQYTPTFRPDDIFAHNADPVVAQSNFAFGDPGTEAGHTIGTLNANLTLTQDGGGNYLFFLRTELLQSLTAADQNLTYTYKLRYSYNGGAYADVTASSSYVQAVADANITDGAATTDRLAGAAGLFAAGEYDEGDGVFDAFTWGNKTGPDVTEMLNSLQVIDADMAAGDTLDFRIYENDNTVLDGGYTNTGRITWNAGATVQPVGLATEQDVTFLVDDAESLAAGLSTEQDVTFALVAAAKTIAVGLATETDQSPSGPDTVVDGDFASSTNWDDSDPSWTVSGGVATASTGFVSQQLLQTAAQDFLTTRLYRVTYTVSRYVSGGHNVALGVNSGGTTQIFSGPGTYTEIIPATINGPLIIVNHHGGTPDFDVDDLSIEPVGVIVNESLSVGLATETDGLPVGADEVTNGTFDSDTAWSKGANWTIAAGVATCDGAVGQMNQDPNLIEGAVYRIRWDVTAYTSGSVSIYMGAGGTPISGDNSASAVGSYERLYRCGDHSVQASITVAPNSFIGSIDNIVVERFGVTAAESLAAGLATEQDLGFNVSTAAAQIIEPGLAAETDGVALGPDLVTNGAFDSDTIWSKGTDWSIAGGVATFNGLPVRDISQTVSLTEGQAYLLRMDVVARTIGAGGGIYTRLGGGSFAAFYPLATGAYERVVLAGPDTDLLIRADGSGTCDFDIDNVTVEAVSLTVLESLSVGLVTETDIVGVEPDSISNGGFDSDTVWIKGANWTIAGGVASKVTGSIGTIGQDIGAVEGEVYRVTYTILNFVTGLARAKVTGTGGDGEGAIYSANGTYTDIITAGSAGTGLFEIETSATSEYDIDNVSCELFGLTVAESLSVGLATEVDSFRAANDTFTDSDSTLIENHTSDSGHSWVLQVGTVEILDNRARALSATSGNRAGLDLAVGTDVTVQAACYMANVPASSSTFVGVTARFATASATTNAVEFVFDEFLNAWTLQASTLIQVAASWPGEGTILRLVVRGANAEGWYSTDGGSTWTLALSRSDLSGSYLTGDYVGILVGNFTENTGWDPEVDNFEVFDGGSVKPLESLATGLSTEQDLSLLVTTSGAVTGFPGLTSEQDLAFAAAAAESLSTGLATEVDEVYGYDAIANGGFDTDTLWDKGAGWTIAGGVATAASPTGFLEQTNANLAVALVDGRTYRVRYTISNYSAGSVDINLGTFGTGATRSADGTYEELIVADGIAFNGVFFNPSATFVADIDNVSVEESGVNIVESLSTGLTTEQDVPAPGADINPDPGFDSPGSWTFGQLGWTVSGSKLNGTSVGENGTAEIAAGLVDGDYLVTYEIESYTGGTIQLFMGGAQAGTTRTAAGVYSEVITVSGASNGNIGFFVYSGGAGSPTFVIDNLTVVPLGITVLKSLSTGLAYESDVVTLGADFITNGGFDTDTGWIKQTGWTISGGEAHAVATNLAIYQTSAVTLVEGDIYRVEFEITSFTSGFTRLELGGAGSPGTDRSAVGVYVEYFAAGSTQTIGFQSFPGAAFTGSIDNVKVQATGLNITVLESLSVGLATEQNVPPLGPDHVSNGGLDDATDWTPVNWVIGSGVCTASGVGQLIQNFTDMTISPVPGHLYRITLDVTSYTSGSITPYLGGTDGAAWNSAGNDQSVDLVAGHAGGFQNLILDGNASMDIDNIRIEPVGITVLEAVTLGLATEQDLALVVTAAGAIVAFPGLTTEQDIPFALTVAEAAAVGLPLEQDTPFALTVAEALALGLTTEQDISFAATFSELREVGLTTEQDLSSGVASGFVAAVTQTTEQDLPFALGIAEAIELGLTSEQDLPFAVSTGTEISVGLPTEQDVAFATELFKTLGLGLTTEQDLTFALGVQETVALTLASEQDVSLSTSVVSGSLVNTATEQDVSFALTVSEALAAGLSTEQDVTQSVNPTLGLVLGLPTEADTAFAVSLAEVVALGLATEQDLSPAASVAKALGIGLTTEQDLSVAIGFVSSDIVGLVVETDSSFSLTVAEARALGLAIETDSSFGAGSLAGALRVDYVVLTTTLNNYLTLQSRLDTYKASLTELNTHIVLETER